MRPLFWVVLDNGVILSAFVRRIDAAAARDRWNALAAADRQERKPICRRLAVGIARSRKGVVVNRSAQPHPKMMDRWAVIDWRKRCPA